MIRTVSILISVLAFSFGKIAAQDDDYRVEKGQGNVRHILYVSGYLHAITASPDGNTLAIGTSSKLYLVSFQTGKLEKSINIGQEILRVAFTPDSKQIVIGGGKGVSLIEVSTGKKIWSAAGIPNPKLKRADPASAKYMSKNIKITAIKYIPAREQFASISEDESSLRFWSIQDGAAAKIIDTKIEEPGVLALSSDAVHLAVRGADGFGQRGSQGTVVLYRLPEMEEMWRNTDGAYGFESTLAFSPDGQFLATGTTSWGNMKVQLLNVKSGETVTKFNLGEGDELNGIAWTLDGKSLVTAAESQVALWKIEEKDKQPILLDEKFKIQDDTNNAVVIGLNGTAAAVLGDSKMVKIYDLMNL